MTEEEKKKRKVKELRQNLKIRTSLRGTNQLRPIARLDGANPNPQGLYTAKNGQKIRQQDLNLAKSLKARVKSRY